MQNNEETQWKKERFRKENQNSTENFETDINPDILYIKKKIKKIQKQKKYREMFNESEPLKNIYENFDSQKINSSHQSKNKSIFENINKNENLQPFPNIVDEEPTKQNSFNFSDLFKCNACDDTNTQDIKLAEGFDVDAGVKNELNKKKQSPGISINFSEYTEPVKRSFNKVNEALFFLPKKINESINNFFLGFVKSFYKIDEQDLEQNTNNIQNDAEILKIICYMIVSFPIAIYICYNWFFLTVYKHTDYAENEFTKEPSRPASDNKRLQITFNGLPPTLRKILNFLFDFGIMPTYIFDMIFLSDESWAVPNLLNFLGSKILIKSVLLFFSITVVYMFDVYNVFENLMLGGAILSNIGAVTGYCTGVIFTYFVYWLVKDIEKLVSPDINLSSTPSIYHVLLKWISNPYIMFFFKIIYYILRFSMAFVNLGISAVFFTLFIWIHSLFGIAIYGKNGFSFDGIKNTMKDINEFIDTDFENVLPLHPDIKEYGIFEKMFFDILLFFKNNMYSFFFIIMIAGSLFNITAYIKSPNLKFIMSSIFSLLGVLILVYKILQGPDKYTETENPSVNKYNTTNYMDS